MSDIDDISASNRSRVTNSRLRGRVTAKSLFVEGDGRSPWARRYRDLVTLLAEDAGGLSRLSEIKLSLVRRAAALTVECERLECEMAKGKRVDVDKLSRTAGHLRRLAETLGLNRVVVDPTPSLSVIAVRHHRARKAGAAIE